MFLPHRTPPLPALSDMDKEAETSRVWQSDRIRPKDPALALNSLTSLILWRFQEKWNCRRWSLLSCWGLKHIFCSGIPNCGPHIMLKKQSILILCDFKIILSDRLPSCLCGLFLRQYLN